MIFIIIILLRTCFAMADTRTLRRGFKIRKFQDSEQIGVAAQSLAELKQRGATRFELQLSMCHIQLVDGTQVLDEEYFSTLEDQTILEFVDDRGG